MSQNPYGPYPSDPNYPGVTDPADAGTQPSSGPMPAIPPQQAGPDPKTPNAGSYQNPPSQPPALPQQGSGGAYYAQQPPQPPRGPGYPVPNPPSFPPPVPQSLPAPGYLPPAASPRAVPNPPSFPPPLPQSIPAPGYAPPQPGMLLPPFPPGYVPKRPEVARPPTLPGYLPPGAPQLTSRPPQKKIESRTIIIFSAILLLIVIAGSIFGLVAYTNNQATLHSNATATAQTRVHTTATAIARATFDARATAAASATALASTFPFSNKLVLSDQLSDNSHVGQYGWDMGANCFFINGSYNVRDPQANSYVTCGAQNTNFANFTLQVQMSVQLGGSTALEGVFFRGNEGAAQYYIIAFDNQGQYLFAVQNNANGHNLRILKQGSAVGFSPGMGSVNTLGIVAQGDQLSIYMNNILQPLFQVTDGSYTTGQIGFIAGADSSGRSVMTYNAVKVWQLP